MIAFVAVRLSMRLQHQNNETGSLAARESVGILRAILHDITVD